jgi:hypothetical protein
MVKMGREAQHILPKNWGVKVFKKRDYSSSKLSR